MLPSAQHNTIVCASIRLSGSFLSSDTNHPEVQNVPNNHIYNHIYTHPSVSGIIWLISVSSSSSLSSVSPLSSPRAPPSSHTDRQLEDSQQQQISGEFQQSDMSFDAWTSGYMLFHTCNTVSCGCYAPACMQQSRLRMRWKLRGRILSARLWRRRCRTRERWCLLYRCEHIEVWVWFWSHSSRVWYHFRSKRLFVDFHMKFQVLWFIFCVLLLVGGNTCAERVGSGGTPWHFLHASDDLALKYKLVSHVPPLCF